MGLYAAVYGISLKLIGWNLAEVNNNVSYFSFNDNIHVVPKYTIYVDEHMSFTIRILLWSVPADHEIYSNLLGNIFFTPTFFKEMLLVPKICVIFYVWLKKKEPF